MSEIAKSLQVTSYNVEYEERTVAPFFVYDQTGPGRLAKSLQVTSYNVECEERTASESPT